METSAVTVEQALQKLMDGNRRYVASNASHPNQSATHRITVAGGQHPFAVILGCADSRVPPELIFDQGLGDLFVIRVAGHVVDDVVLGSIEYAVEHLAVRLVVVLGHQECGAVKATMQGGEAPAHIGSLVRAIQPAVNQAKRQSGDPLENAVSANVQLALSQLKGAEPLLAKLHTEGALHIVGAYYALYTGLVNIIA